MLFILQLTGAAFESLTTIKTPWEIRTNFMCNHQNNFQIAHQAL